MPIEFQKHRIAFQGVVTVEEAESLVEWLQTEPGAQVDLSACSHMHTANLQVLIAGGIAVSSWPRDSTLRAWLETALISAERATNHG